MRKLLFAIIIGLPFIMISQNQDFERSGFAVKAVAMNTAPERLLKYNFEEGAFQPRFNLRPLFQQETRQYEGPLVYGAQRTSAVGNKSKEDYYKRVPSLNSKDIYAFGKDGTINSVKNIAYKPAIRGNIAGAYCTAIYAARSGN